MLSKKNRISGKDLIQNLFQCGKTYKDSFLVIKFTESDSENSRFAVSVSKKISKKAVERNLMRRQVYEVVRHLLPELKKNIFAMIIVRHPLFNESSRYQKAYHSIQNFFKSI